MIALIFTQVPICISFSVSKCQSESNKMFDLSIQRCNKFKSIGVVKIKIWSNDRNVVNDSFKNNNKRNALLVGSCPVRVGQSYQYNDKYNNNTDGKHMEIALPRDTQNLHCSVVVDWWLCYLL